MMSNVQNYLLSLIGVGFLSAIAQALIPQGSLKKCVVFVCGLLLILTAIRPVVKIDLSDLAQSIGRMQVEQSDIHSEIKIENQKIISALIKEKSESYIWDKAKETGIDLQSIQVKISTEKSYPYPVNVIICGEFTNKQRQQLSEWIEHELAIGKEHQEWLWNESQSSG